MCKICVDLTLGTLTSKEARRNLSEFNASWNPKSAADMHVEHVEKVRQKINEKEEEELKDEPEPFDGQFTD